MTETMTSVDKVYELLDGLNDDEKKKIMCKFLNKRYNINERMKDYYYKNKEVILQKRKERLENDEEMLRVKQVKAEWYEKYKIENREKIRERNKRNYERRKAEKMAEKANKAVKV